MDKAVLSKLHSAVAAYVMPEHAKALILSKELVLLCGVTASGKNTIADYLVEHGLYDHVVSHTTRKPRSNQGIMEKNGREYWFVEPNQMLTLIEQNGFIEVKAVHGDTCYGTSIESVERVLAQGKHPVMEIDVQGALELTQVVPGLRPIFVMPPSHEVWMQRLGARGGISEEDRERRMRSASMELRVALDHPAFILEVNHEVEYTAAEIMAGLKANPELQSANRDLAQYLLDVTGGM